MYICKSEVLKAYAVLSQLTDDPTKQGATQIVSTIRYFVALDEFHTKNLKGCNTQNSDTLEFIKYVGRVVKIQHLYTVNFYNNLKDIEDFGVSSNFLSVGAVRLSKENTVNKIDYPRRGHFPLFYIINGTLNIEDKYYEHINEYLKERKFKKAFIIWLLRNEKLDYLSDERLLVLKESLSKIYSKRLVSILFKELTNDDFKDEANFFDELYSEVLIEDIYKLFERDVIKKIMFEDNSFNQIFYGAPGTGKSFIINQQTYTYNKNVIRTTFHPDSDYSTFVGSYKPTAKVVPMYSTYGDKATLLKDEQGEPILENKIVYEFVPQAFLKAYTDAWKLISNAETFDKAEPQFLIIEEINRGNCAQIFGDLFQLLDRNEYGFSDYAIHSDNDLKNYLKHEFKGLSIDNKEQIDNIYKGSDIIDKVLTGEILLLPSNLYIWATMNTSDQSLFPIDSAFKRRWDWQYMPINDERKEFVIQIADAKYDWWAFISNINEKIDQITGSEDKKLGYWFAKPAGNGTTITCNQFVSKVLFYLWNDVYKDYADDIRSIFRINEDTNSNKISFTDFFVADPSRKFDEDKLFKFMQYNGITQINKEEDSLSTGDQ